MDKLDILGESSTFELMVAYEDENLIFLRPNEILFMEKQDRKTILHTEKGKCESRKTLRYYETKLEGEGFFRSHKSFLINLNKVDRCIPQISYGYDVCFKNSNKTAEISRNRVKELRRRINF